MFIEGYAQDHHSASVWAGIVMYLSSLPSSFSYWQKWTRASSLKLKLGLDLEVRWNYDPVDFSSAEQGGK